MKKSPVVQAQKIPLASLNRYWGEWETKLQLLVKMKSAKLYFPPCLVEAGPDHQFGHFTYTPKDPICLFNAPYKASTNRTAAASNKLIIFINGNFEILPGSKKDEAHTVRSTTCNITFYISTINEKKLELSFFDALHFDHEIDGKVNAFHPVFHAQRGATNSLTDELIREMVSKNLSYTAENIKIDNENIKNIGMPYLRLPTPQLDLLSALTLVMADFFCNGGSNDKRIKTSFQTILSHLRKIEAIMGIGLTSNALKNRIDVQPISTAHWYEESVF
ncbi:MAG: hypothetical protein CFE38_02025 [Comamonadaceae bacterium PBBC1]|nr:MAG: hypothetical protein CFE38_02025 [Comamonadaceae bacterium PBBC1]